MRPLTPAEVDLLHSDDLEVSAGLEVLRPDLTVREDVSDDLVGGKVSRALLNTIHGQCRINVTRELVWGNDLVRPYMILSDGVTTLRYNLGVYCLTSPDRRVGETPATYEVTGWDRLYHLQRPIIADFTATAGTTYRAALLAIFAVADVSGVLIEGASADATIPKTKTWTVIPNDQSDPDQTSTPVTYLRIINDLQQQWNGRGVWCDEDGLYRCEAYRSPSSQPVEHTFSADDLRGDDAKVVKTILGEDRSITEDVWQAPNYWRATASNPPEGVTPSEANGLVQIRQNLTDGPTSQAARKPSVWASILSYEAASSTALAGLIDRRVEADRSVTTTYNVTVGPFPLAGHASVYRYVDAGAGVDRKVQLMSFELDLTGEDMPMEWQAIQ